MPKTGEVITFDDKPSLQSRVTDDFVAAANTAVADRGVCRVSLSGGSTPKAIYAALAARDLPWDSMRWFWGDERNVEPDHDDSNQRMVREAMLTPAGGPESTVFPVPVDILRPDAAAAAYERTMREEFGDIDAPAFDIVLLGMGDDAHTSSLFPGTAALAVKDRWFVENHVPKMDGYRYTSTYPAINAGREIWFLVTGANKREALDAVWNGERDLERFPSQGIDATRWYVTKDAVG